MRASTAATDPDHSPDEPDGVIEATLTADGDHTILVIEDRGLPLTQIAAYGQETRSTSKISPPT